MLYCWYNAQEAVRKQIYAVQISHIKLCLKGTDLQHGVSRSRIYLYQNKNFEIFELRSN